jgi:ABC-2 type transport system ATP-binding protein
MRGRLLLACALVGEPAALVLDEPTTGLDRDGVQWLWQLLRAEAARGCAILVSSHALHELEEVADAVAILVQGRLVAFGPAADLGGHGRASRVRSSDGERLAGALTAAGIAVRRLAGDELLAEADAALVGSIALEHGIVVCGLSDAGADLGALYDELTRT